MESQINTHNGSNEAELRYSMFTYGGVVDTLLLGVRNTNILPSKVSFQPTLK